MWLGFVSHLIWRTGSKEFTFVSEDTSQKRPGNGSNTIPWEVSYGEHSRVDLTTYMAPINPVYMGRFCNGTEYATICNRIRYSMICATLNSGYARSRRH